MSAIDRIDAYNGLRAGAGKPHRPLPMQRTSAWRLSATQRTALGVLAAGLVAAAITFALAHHQGHPAMTCAWWAAIAGTLGGVVRWSRGDAP